MIPQKIIITIPGIKALKVFPIAGGTESGSLISILCLINSEKIYAVAKAIIIPTNNPLLPK